MCIVHVFSFLCLFFVFLFCFCLLFFFVCFFFFFQAEDGIRDRDVTGVQTVLFRSCCMALLWVPSFALALLTAFFSLDATPVLIISNITFSRGESPDTSRMTSLTATALFETLPFMVTGLVFQAILLGLVTTCPWLSPT